MDDTQVSEQTAETTTESTTGAISAQDRIEIAEILSFSSHLLDNRQWDMFGEVFVPGVRLSAPQGEFDGPAGVRRFVESVDLARFPATHTLNSIVEAVDADTAVCWSRMLLLTWDRRVACGDYIDTFRRTADGWRIERRTVAPRNDSASAALAEAGYVEDPRLRGSGHKIASAVSTLRCESAVSRPRHSHATAGFQASQSKSQPPSSICSRSSRSRSAVICGSVNSARLGEPGRGDRSRVAIFSPSTPPATGIVPSSRTAGRSRSIAADARPGSGTASRKSRANFTV